MAEKRLPSQLLTFQQVLHRIADWENRPNLLLGNGFSCSVHPGFKYGSLYELALGNGLPPNAVSIFERCGTSNFEAVMRLLEDTDWIAKQYGAFAGVTESPMLCDLRVVREALVKAISQTHPKHTFALDDNKKASCQKFLKHFHDVFTINYDLLLYWVLQGTGDRVDGFGFPNNNSDNPPYLTLSQPKDHRRWMYHLHGALHIYSVDGEARKHRYQYQQRPLLDTICEGIMKAEYPLFVAEGSAHQKMKQIRNSMYLSMCFGEFGRSSRDLVCYGMSFGESDNHISDAIADNKGINRLFVGLYGDWESEANLKVRASISRIQEQRDRQRGDKTKLDVDYFDSETAAVWNSDQDETPLGIRAV